MRPRSFARERPRVESYHSRAAAIRGRPPATRPAACRAEIILSVRGMRLRFQADGRVNGSDAENDALPLDLGSQDAVRAVRRAARRSARPRRWGQGGRPRAVEAAAR